MRIRLALSSKNDFETEESVTICVAAKGIAKTKFLRASVDPLLGSNSNSLERQYCVNQRTELMSLFVNMRTNFAKALV